jgi:heme exporter protein A
VSVSISQLSARRDAVNIFEPIDLELDQPTAVEVVGPNGAGKTTLLRTMAGLYEQFDGTFNVPPLLYQGHRLGLDELETVAQNLMAYAELENRQVSEKTLRRVLSKTGMLRHGLALVGKLSQGQQRRVCMARWLLSERPLWLLDEPLTALDQKGQQLLVKLISDHVAAAGWVIYSSHVGLEIEHKVTVQVTAL